jgi:hypothetical protein
MATEPDFENSYLASFVLENDPDRRAVLDRFFESLKRLPVAVGIASPPDVVEEEIAAYLRRDPDAPPKVVVRGPLVLAATVGIGGGLEAFLHIFEASTELVQADLSFRRDEIDCFAGKPSNRPHLKAFTLELIKAAPVLIATLGRAVDSIDVVGLDDVREFRLADHIPVRRMAELDLSGSWWRYDYFYDFIFIAPAASGANRPIAYEVNNPGVCDMNDWHNLRLVASLQRHEAEAERFYTRMYDSRTPKEDRDDACAELSRAIEVAQRLGLEKEEAWLTERQAHIRAVYESQFRSIY